MGVVVVGVGGLWGEGVGGGDLMYSLTLHTGGRQVSGRGRGRGRGRGSGGTSQAPTSTFVIYGQHFVF